MNDNVIRVKSVRSITAEINSAAEDASAPAKKKRTKSKKEKPDPTIPAATKKEAKARVKELRDREMIAVTSADMDTVTEVAAADAKEAYILGLRQGKQRAVIAREVSQKYGLSALSMRNVMQAAARDLSEEYQTYINEVAQMNTAVLQTIVERTVESGDYRTAIMAMQELNKLAGVYSSGPALKAETINITFGS